MLDLRPNLVSIGGENRREEKRRGEEEEEKKKKRREEERKIKKVWISMIFGMDFTWKARILWFCMEF